MANETHLYRLVVEWLRVREGQSFSPAEITDGLINEYHDQLSQKAAAQHGSVKLKDQVQREIYAYLKPLKDYGIQQDRTKRPLRLFFDNTVSPSSPTIPDISSTPSTTNLSAYSDSDDEPIAERSLYKLLQQYLFEEHRIVTVVIRENTSSNKRGRNGNKWLHPDIVGMIPISIDWNPLVRDCFIRLPAKQAELVSIEVKVILNSGNIRESFFQAVSNSLWANYAYLAAKTVKGTDTLDELTILCSLHGVGFISIDDANFTESRVIIQPRKRDMIDWESANRIAEENGDFREYLKLVNNYLKTGELHNRLWGTAHS